MQRTTNQGVNIAELRSFADRPVRVRLDDGSEHTGVLRTELLGDASISVFLARDERQGATLYIDEITGIWPIS
jgi:hypothetical protein